MANKHYNGKEPYEIPASEYDKQAELWRENGGNIRDDEPHGGTDYPHSHWYDGDNKNEDFVVVKDNDSSEKDDDHTGSFA